MRPIFAALLLAVLLVGGTACSKKKTGAEMAAERAKAFREKQRVEAIKAYTALSTKYPDSQFAPKAQERLNVLGPLPVATPAKKK